MAPVSLPCPLQCVCVCLTSLLLFVTTKCLRLILDIPAPVLEGAISLRSPVPLLENGISNQNLGTSCAHGYCAAIASEASQLTE